MKYKATVTEYLITGKQKTHDCNIDGELLTYAEFVRVEKLQNIIQTWTQDDKDFIVEVLNKTIEFDTEEDSSMSPSAKMAQDCLRVIASDILGFTNLTPVMAIKYRIAPAHPDFDKYFL